MFSLLFLLPAHVVVAQMGATNTISLEQCLRLALENNLRIQINRIDPAISRYTLSGSYAIYDPTFEARYLRSDRSQEADVVGGVFNRANQRTADTYSAGVVGELPLGLQYDIGLDVVRQQETVDAFVDVVNMTTNEMISVDNYNADLGIDLRQPLLRDFWISDTRAQIRLNRRNLRISEEALILTIMTTVRDVQLAYYDLIAALDQVKVRQMAVELAQKLFDENKKRVAAGVLAPLDEKQAESEVATAKAALIAAQAEVSKQENILKNLLSDNFERWSPVRITPTEKLLAVPQDYSRADSWANALERRPDFHQLKQELEKQGILVRLRYNQLFPALDLVGSYGRSGLDDDLDGAFRDIEDENNPRHTFGVILSVPLSRRRERNDYRVARDLERQLELQLKELHQNIIVEVENAIIDVQSAYDQIPARREARRFAEAALDAEQKKLENGKSTSFFVLQLQRDLTDARALEIRALADYNKAMAELYFREGTILERNKISVNFQ